MYLVMKPRTTGADAAVIDLQAQVEPPFSLAEQYAQARYIVENCPDRYACSIHLTRESALGH